MADYLEIENTKKLVESLTEHIKLMGKCGIDFEDTTNLHLIPKSSNVRILQMQENVFVSFKY